MKCPKCGANNADYLFYCGSCGAGLHDAPEDSAEAPQRRELVPWRGRASTPDHRAALKKQLRMAAIFFAAFLVYWSFRAVIFLTDGEWNQDDLLYSLPAVIGVVIVVYLVWASSSREAMTFMRTAGWVGEVYAVAPCVNIIGMIAGPIVIVAAALTTGLLSENETALLISLAVASVMLVSLLAVILIRPPKMTIEAGGICVGYHSMNRLFIPFDRISSITLKKRMLKITLDKRHVLGTKGVRLLLLGDIGKVREIIDKVAPSGVPVAPLQSLQQRPVEPKVHLVKDYTFDLTIVGGMLIFSGVLAFMNVLFLTAIFDDAVLNVSPLFCCSSLEVVLGAIAIIGGVQTLRRRKYKMAVAGSIAAIVSLGGLIISPILGAAALVIAYKRRDQFDE